MPIDYKKDNRYAHLSLEQVQKHYLIEKELRGIILNSSPSERTEKILWAYEEAFSPSSLASSNYRKKWRRSY